MNGSWAHNYTNGLWNNSEQNGGAPTNACAASNFCAAGNGDRLSIREVPGVSLTIIGQFEFAIATLPSGWIYRFTFARPRCTDFGVQVGQDTGNNPIVTPV